MLVRNVGLKGQQKISDRWQHKVYTDQPNPDIPVFVVRHKDGTGRCKTLHRNLLLPISVAVEEEPDTVETTATRPRGSPELPEKQHCHPIPHQLIQMPLIQRRLGQTQNQMPLSSLLTTLRLGDWSQRGRLLHLHLWCHHLKITPSKTPPLKNQVIAMFSLRSMILTFCAIGGGHGGRSLIWGSGWPGGC